MKNRLSEIMKEKGINAPRLAELVDTSNQQIYRLMKGQRNIDLRWIDRLSKALKVEPQELIAKTDTPVALEAMSAKIVKVGIEALVACFPVIDHMVNKKEIRQDQAWAILEKTVKYFWADFDKGKPPTDEQIRKFAAALLD